MMGHQSRQMAMLFVDIESLIPETHLLRKIERMVSFDFIYDLLAPYYPATGRPSVDPVSMFKMLLIGLSERRLVEEVQLNITYRWFCGFELDDTIPNHSTFSKTRTRKWQQSSLFQKAFYEIVKQCIDSGLIDGEAMAADGSYIPANVSRESWINVETEVEQSMQSYLDSLDEELSNQPGFKKPPTKIVRKCRTTSQTDPDSGYINHGSKRGIGYLMEATVDCKHGILTGVDVYILPWILLRSTARRIHLSGRSSSYVPQAKLQQIDGQISAVLPGRGQFLRLETGTLYFKDSKKGHSCSYGRMPPCCHGPKFFRYLTIYYSAGTTVGFSRIFAFVNKSKS